MFTKLNRLISIGSIAMLVFASCSREQQVAEQNPTYNPDENTVTTQFVLNISTNAGPDSKMTSTNVQLNNNFRGIDGAHLMAYDLTYNTNPDHLWWVSHESSKALRDFDLGTIALAGSVTAENSRKVLELTLPLGTNVLLFYGKAIKDGTDNAQGKVDLSGTALNSTLDNVVFRLSDRLEDSDGFKDFTTLVGVMLTNFFRLGLAEEKVDDGFIKYRDLRYAFWWPQDNTSKSFRVRDDSDNLLYANGTAGTGEYEGYTYYCGSKLWKEYGDIYNSNRNDLTTMEEDLGLAYAACTTIASDANGTELRAGSSRALCRIITDMYQVVLRVYESTTVTTVRDEIARRMAELIKNSISNYFNVSDPSDIKFNTIAMMNPTIYTYIGKTITELYPNLTDTYFSSEDGVGFPMNLNLPAGAAILGVRSATKGSSTYDEFYYYRDIPAYGIGGGNSTVPVENYRFPAELMYFGNSPIRVSNNTHKTEEYPKTNTAWNNASNWSGWTQGSVTSTTRSVAMIDEINYGSALLCSKIKYADDIEYLEDNNNALHEQEPNNKISVLNDTPFTVTGILIGGQPDKVGWNYIPLTTNNPFDKLIYDKMDPFIIPATGSSAERYTLLWDNYKEDAGEDQLDVYVALEIENNSGSDFWGEHNLVRNGGVFYLLGMLSIKDAENLASLKPSEGNSTPLSRSNYYYPPYNGTNGATVQIPRVFMQDYMTTATLILNKTSLQHAYVTVPDLKASQVSMGLSVDLNWETGLNFNVIMGGDTTTE